MYEFQEFPKMLYHSRKGPRPAKDAAEESQLKAQGYSNQAPAQFDENGNVPEPSNGPDTSNMPNQNTDPTREPALVSQIEQEATRLAGNQGAKDPAELLHDEENGDENAEDLEPAKRAPAKKAK
jgi:hypothetical protein